jgi:hypothetical protein
MNHLNPAVPEAKIDVRRKSELSLDQVVGRAAAVHEAYRLATPTVGHHCHRAPRCIRSELLRQRRSVETVLPQYRVGGLRLWRNSAYR